MIMKYILIKVESLLKPTEEQHLQAPAEWNIL